MNSTQGQTATPQALAPMIFGYVVSRMITAAVRVGLIDELGDATWSTADLAEVTNTHEDSIKRLLRALTVLGLTSQESNNRFKLSALGSYLRSDAGHSMHPAAMMASDGAIWQAWGDMEHSLRTGKPAFDHLQGKGLFDYLADHEQASADFYDLMASNTRTLAPAIVEGYYFSTFEKVVDIGGGDGTLIAALLQNNTNTRGVVYDTADGLKDASAVLGRAGVEHRCELRQGDFFESVPAGGDAYVLKNVLNDWDDDRAATILQNCAQAASTTGGKVLIIAAVMPEYMGSQDAMVPVMGDIEMLVTTGGRERGLEDYKRLFARSELMLGEVVQLPRLPVYCVVEALPA